MSDDKDTVERAFRCGAISVLVATSTLAAGVNLPAQRVIVAEPWIGMPHQLLTVSRFQQMAGRAGRAGIDTKGEAILMLDTRHPGRVEKLQELITSKVSACHSSFIWFYYTQNRSVPPILRAWSVLKHTN